MYRPKLYNVQKTRQKSPESCTLYSKYRQIMKKCTYRNRLLYKNVLVLKCTKKAVHCTENLAYFCTLYNIIWRFQRICCTMYSFSFCSRTLYSFEESVKKLSGKMYIVQFELYIVHNIDGKLCILCTMYSFFNIISDSVHKLLRNVRTNHCTFFLSAKVVHFMSSHSTAFLAELCLGRNQDSWIG